jgi:hypothetical protein
MNKGRTEAGTHPPPSHVVVFPQAKRVDLVRGIAREVIFLEEKGGDVEEFWNSAFKSLSRDLATIGLTDEGVAREAWSVKSAIVAEICRIQLGSCRVATSRFPGSADG